MIFSLKVLHTLLTFLDWKDLTDWGMKKISARLKTKHIQMFQIFQGRWAGWDHWSFLFLLLIWLSLGYHQAKRLRFSWFLTASAALHLSVWGTESIIHPLLAPSGALVAIPTYYWSTTTTHPLFQITPVLNTGLSLSEPLQLYKGYNAI